MAELRSLSDLIRIAEHGNITTVGALLDALDGLPNNLPISDTMGEPLMITTYRDAETGKEVLEIC
jgi:hypothetical protein